MNYLAKINKHLLIDSPTALLLLAGVWITSMAFFLWCQPQGDDLAYARAFWGTSPDYDSLLDYPLWAVRHWIHVNGRWPNYILPFLASSPSWVSATICATMVTLMYWLVMKCASVLDNAWLTAAVAAVLCFAMPWWDYFMIYACQVNYVWGLVTVLAAWLLIFRYEGKPEIWQYVICFLAGCSHEAGSFSLAAGCLVYLLINKGCYNRRQWQLIGCVAAGCLVVISPGLINRACTWYPPDETPLGVALISAPITLFTWGCTIAACAFSAGRKKIGRFLHNPMSTFAWATIPSVAICMYGGIVGRSGWYAQAFTIIPVFWYASRVFKRQRTGLAIALAAITICQLAATAIWQRRVGSELKAFTSHYSVSDNGAVEMPLTYDNEVPWYVLNKTRGIPDYDDYYLREQMALYYRTDSLCPLAIPSGDNAHRHITSDTLPAGAVKVPYDIFAVMYLYNNDGETWVAVPYNEVYACQPQVFDPGDRNKWFKE